MSRRGAPDIYVDTDLYTYLGLPRHLLRLLSGR